jgi:hypothetical protein
MLHFLLQGQYLAVMSADLHGLEACTAALQISRGMAKRPDQRTTVREGTSLAKKCYSW